MQIKLISFLIFYLILSNTEAQDQQWLIKNNVGKNKTYASGQNIYDESIMNLPFQFTNTHWPGFPTAKNDVFVIYDDGTFWSTRNQQVTPFISYQYGQPSQLHSPVFLAPPGKEVQYFYLSNIYESDDPPALVQSETVRNIPPNTPICSLGVTLNAPMLSANHNPAEAKDITLILNLNALENISPDSYVAPYFLEYNEVNEIGAGTASFDDHFFITAPVFHNGLVDLPGLPSSAYMQTNQPGKIKINPGAADYLFYNIQCGAALNAYFPDESGNPRYNAIFKITDSHGAIVYRIAEQILFSHDPNFLQVQSICTDGPNDIVSYYLQIQNTGQVDANGVAVTMWLPPTLNGDCLEVLEWNVAGSSTSGTVSHFNQFYSFVFDNATLPFCQKSRDNSFCTAFIRFKVKGNTGLEFKNLGHTLQPYLIRVRLGRGIYEIHEFRDVVDERINTEFDNLFYLQKYRPVSKETCSFLCSPNKTEIVQAKDLIKHLKRNERLFPGLPTE